MTTVATLELKDRSDEILERVEAGEEVVLVRGGTEVARIIPSAKPPSSEFARLAEEWREKRKGLTLGGLKVRDLINEGRR